MFEIGDLIPGLTFALSKANSTKLGFLKLSVRSMSDGLAI
jgi:hypothetical protein